MQQHSHPKTSVPAAVLAAVPPAVASKCDRKRTAESPATGESSAKAARLEGELLACSSCLELKPKAGFSGNQLGKKAKRRCRECV